MPSAAAAAATTTRAKPGNQVLPDVPSTGHCASGLQPRPRAREASASRSHSPWWMSLVSQNLAPRTTKNRQCATTPPPLHPCLVQRITAVQIRYCCDGTLSIRVRLCRFGQRHGIRARKLLPSAGPRSCCQAHDSCQPQRPLVDRSGTCSTQACGFVTEHRTKQRNRPLPDPHHDR